MQVKPRLPLVICKYSALTSAEALELWSGTQFYFILIHTELWLCLLQGLPVISDSYYFSLVQVRPCLGSTFVAPPARFSAPFSSKKTLKFQGMPFYSSLWAETYMRQTSSLAPSSLCQQQRETCAVSMCFTQAPAETLSGPTEPQDGPERDFSTAR